MLEDSTLEVRKVGHKRSYLFIHSKVESGSIYLRIVKLQDEELAPYR